MIWKESHLQFYQITAKTANNTKYLLIVVEIPKKTFLHKYIVNVIISEISFVMKLFTYRCMLFGLSLFKYCNYVLLLRIEKRRAYFRK